MLKKIFKRNGEYKKYMRFYYKIIKPHIYSQIIIFIIWIITASLGLISPYLTKILVDGVLVQNSIKPLYLYILFRLVLYFLKIFIESIQSIVSTKFSYRLLFDLQYKLYQRIFEKEIQFFHENKPGDIINRIINETSQIVSLFGNILMNIVIQIYSIIAVMVIMFSIDYKFTLLAVSVVPLIVIISKFFNKRFREHSLNLTYIQGKVTNVLQESINSAYTVKTYNIYQYVNSKFKNSLNEYLNEQFRFLYINLANKNILYSIKFIPQALFLYFGGKMVIENKISIGDMLAFLSYMSMVYEPINSLSSINAEVQKNFIAFKRYYEIYQESFKEFDSIDEKTKVQIEGIDIINVEDISFSYSKEMNIFENISFTAKKGDCIIIKGQNGAGKTTLLNLLSGLYRPTVGKILINNQDINTISTSNLIKNIGIITQDTFLFRDTIEKNITLERAINNEYFLNEIANKLPIYDFISELPNGFGHEVTDKGNNLSGGQKQKIGILRGLVTEPSLLLMDEPTASIDQRSNLYLMDYLKEIQSEKIIIMITHDENLLEMATKVIDLDTYCFISESKI